MKRFVDVLLAAFGLAILGPFLGLLAVLIKTGSPGPAFYRGVRTGLGGKPFRIFKFRTMVVDAERIGGPSTANGDPRVTPIGSVLRKYKLDELPQILNVLTGDMSFVGPRPEVPIYTDLYTEEEKIILSVRPGITDWATLWNPDEGALLAGEPDPEKAYLEKVRPTKIRLQLEYVKNQSVLTDLQIILATMGVVGRKAVRS